MAIITINVCMEYNSFLLNKIDCLLKTFWVGVVGALLLTITSLKKILSSCDSKFDKAKNHTSIHACCSVRASLLLCSRVNGNSENE